MAKKGKLVRSPSDKAQYMAYALEMRHEKNKLKKLLKTSENQPNNKQIDSLKVKYTRDRKSLGHICKGLYNSLGFINNQPNTFMLKGKAPIHLYQAGNIKLDFNHKTPNHGRSMCEQLEELGFKRKRYGKRKYKKTAR